MFNVDPPPTPPPPPSSSIIILITIQSHILPYYRCYLSFTRSLQSFNGSKVMRGKIRTSKQVNYGKNDEEID
ncbi:hypothetical protein BLOT_002900 [Blomia tropicalis]|nr:hypothetical protein BLOT_002900 [Blomia tropicalis]